MPNQYTPQKRTIGELLSMTNPPILVPEWQRNYSWTSSEAGTFWQDLLTFDRTYPGANVVEQEYFLGCVVVVNNGTSHLLLDGQQRLATAAILLSVIRDFLRRYSQDAATRVSTRYLNDYDDATQRTVFKLTLNVYDRDFFKREVLENRDGEYVAPDPQIQSHRSIREVRDFFLREFESQATKLNNPAELNAWVLRIQQVLVGHMSVVAVYSTDQDNATSVFEALNDRGIGLSTPDLVRSFLLRRAAEQEKEEIVELWGEIWDLDDEVKVDVFLRHFWLSKAGDVKTRSLYREIKSRLTEDAVNSLDFTRELSQSAEAYNDLIRCRSDDADFRDLLKTVRELGANLFYPVLLSGLHHSDIEQLRRLTQALINVFVRHNVVGKLNNAALESFAYSMAKTLRADGNYQAAIDKCRAFAPSDERFKQQFAEVSITRQATARYILRELEMALRKTGELEVARPSRVHVEHIYPQTPQDGQRWPEHSAYVHRLGNLTLLARRINVAIRNGTFTEKLTPYQGSDLLLTKELLSETEWSPATIRGRQARLAQMAPEIWKLL